MKKIIIAIDGYSSCGKSTLAKDLAKSLGYIYIDSGAMYRAVALHMMLQNVDIANKNAVIHQLTNINIHFETNPETNNVITFLNGDNVEEAIRAPRIAQAASQVSTIKEVRAFLVQQQQIMGKQRGIVMDGRDIGTVVFKDAEVKIFLTADVETRAKRRMAELTAKNIKTTLSEVINDLNERDIRDTQRDESPLFKADDAVMLDNSFLSRERQKHLLLNLIQGVIDGTHQME